MLKNQTLFSVFIMGMIAVTAYSVPLVFDKGDYQFSAYSGSLTVTTGHTDGTFLDPVTRIESPDPSYGVANQNFASVNLSAHESLELDIYGDNSGQVWRISLWSGPLGNPFLYKDLIIDWTGWQSFSLNFDGTESGLAFWANGTSETWDSAIQQITVFSVQAWNAAGTIYIDNAKVRTDVIVPPIIVTADAYNEHRNLISNSYAEQDFTAWYHAANSDIYLETASVGTKCFRLSPSGSHSDIRSVLYPIDAKQAVKFMYSFKSLPASTITPGSSYAYLRCFDDSNMYLGGGSYELETTDGAWSVYEHELMIPAGTTQFDVVFNTDVNDNGEALGQFLVDDIMVYRELYPLDLKVDPIDTLHVIRKSTLNNPEFLLMQSLQGILAQTKPEIYIDEGRSEYLNHLVSDYGISYVRNDSISFYIDKYNNVLDGYILYDINDHQSMLAASSLAGILNAAMVDVTLESTVVSYGLTNMIMDVRGKDCQWVYLNYWDQFNHNGIMMKQPDIGIDGSAYYMRDWSIAQKLMWWWDSNYAITSEVLDKVIDNSHCWGWDDPAAPGELGATSFHSQHSLYTGATAAVCNVSVTGAVGQNTPDLVLAPKNADNTYTAEDNVHYVCFMMSDMDNMGTELGAYGWHVNSGYFANTHRGDFPMGWGLPAAFVELAPNVTDYWYDQAYETDSFSATCSGLGYMYASEFPDLENHTRKLEQLMTRSGQRTAVISDHFWPGALTYNSYYDIAHKYTRLDPVRGLFFFDVNGDYARYGRQADIGNAERIYWFDRKPFVPCRFTLWESGQYAGLSSNGLELAASINALPTDPSNPDSYTFVMVHAWSFGYRPMDEVAIVVNNLDPDVRVVTPDELIEQIYMNLSTCGQAPIKADINGDCTVNLEDFALLSEDWLAITYSGSDLWQDGAVEMKDLMEFLNLWLD